MAVQVSDNGDMQLALQVKDEGSAVLEKFADNADASFAKAATAAEQSIEKAAETTKEATKKIDTNWGEVGKGVAQVAWKVGTFAALVGLAGMKIGDSMKNAADKIGINAGALQELHYAAGLVNISGGQVNTVMRDMNRFLADAAEKGGKSAELLAKMGLSAEQLKKAGPDEAFRKITQAISEMKDPMDRTQTSMAIFKKGGDDAFRLADAIKEAGNDARSFGLVMSDEAYEGSDKFYKSIYRLTEQLKGISTIVANHVAGPFGEMARIFANAVRDSGALVGVGNILGTVLRGIGAIAVLVGGAFAVMGKAMGGIAGIMGLIARGEFKGAFSAFQGMSEDINETIKKIGELEGKLLGLTGPGTGAKAAGGMKKMGFTRGAGGNDALGGGLHTWSDILPGAELKAANDSEAEAMEEHELAMITRRRGYLFELQSMDAEGAKARQQIVTMAMRGEIGAIGTMMGEAVGLMQSKSRTMFNIGKAAAITEATISTYQAVTNALAIKPFWVGLAMAGVAAAKGFANVQAIKSTQFGSAAATPVFNANPNTGIPTLNAPAANDGNASEANPVQASSRFSSRENVTLVGEFFTQDWMREKMIPMINKAQRDGVYLDFYQVAA